MFRTKVQMPEALIRSGKYVMVKSVLISSLFISTAFGIPADKIGIPENTGPNWAGVTVESDEILRFTQIGGTWRVPKVTFDKSSTETKESFSQWIGVGGLKYDSNENLLQIGIMCNNVKRDCRVFYEKLPAYPEYSFSVDPGDIIFAQIREVYGKKNVWSLFLWDKNKNSTFSTKTEYVSLRDSVEWIVERDMDIKNSKAGKEKYFDLPNFKEVVFFHHNFTAEGGVSYCTIDIDDGNNLTRTRLKHNGNIQITKIRRR
ncbi:MAG: G1 family glutamic endopeptidase [Candidatus Micrarchaeaceae archaeon]